MSMPTSPEIYKGETVYLSAEGTDPVTGGIIHDATWTADIFFAPKNPKANVSDRTPDLTVSPSVTLPDGRVIFEVSTSGFPAGVTYWRATVSGTTQNYNAWSYGSFPLAA